MVRWVGPGHAGVLSARRTRAIPITATMQPAPVRATASVQVPSTQRQWLATLADAPCASSPIALGQIPAMWDRLKVRPEPTCQDHAHVLLSVASAQRNKAAPMTI